jgi:hypothetical protein
LVSAKAISFRSCPPRPPPDCTRCSPREGR